MTAHPTHRSSTSDDCEVRLLVLFFCEGRTIRAMWADSAPALFGLNGRPDLARSGPEIGLHIATVRAAATVEGSAARPSHPTAGTRHRRPYLRGG